LNHQCCCFKTLGGAAFPADEVHRIVQDHTKKLKELEKRYTAKCKDSNVSAFYVPVKGVGRKISKGATKKTEKQHY